MDELRAAEKLPTWLVRYTAYQDALAVEVEPGTYRTVVDEFLRQTFGARALDTSRIALESSPTAPRSIAIDVEEIHDESRKQPRTASFTPSFRRVVALPQAGRSFEMPPELNTNSPEMVAFYSFKGGVGRTTHLLAYLRAASEQRTKRRALIVDADLEAPGITALMRNETSVPNAEFSFIDLLSVLQSDESEDFHEALELAEYMTSKQVFSVTSRESSIEHFFIPAFRSEEQAMRLDIRPEHITSRPGKSWLLTEFLTKLGERLKVDVVLIDLRAGYSELSSPFLFDPRIRRIVVTTPSSQSIQGTTSVLRQLSKVSNALGWDRSVDPTVVLSFVLPELNQSRFEEEAIAAIRQSYMYPEGRDDESELQITVTSFAQELLYFSSVSQAIEKLESSSLVRRMNEFVEVDLRQKDVEFPGRHRQIDELRKQLTSLAEKMEYAESGKGDEFLHIAPVRTLARQYASAPPIAVVIGAKGSGKTYTFLQILRAKNWGNFIKRMNKTDQGDGALLWPVLHSRNLTSLAQSIVSEARNRALASTAATPLPTLSDIADAVRVALRTPDTDEVWWRQKWFEIFTHSLYPFTTATNAYAGELINHLRNTGQQLLLMIDGLEDLFPDIANSRTEQVALRALLQGVPNYLREVPDSPLGVLVLVRADLARTAITQNYGQFSRLYDAFALEWNEEEALRLAVWLARSAGMQSSLGSPKPPELLSTDEAKEELMLLWGPKLGSEKSREARSAEWIIAALSDFKGQIQARDLVRFLRYAAQESIGAESYDRILVPTAIRNAIRPCGIEKVQESLQEIPQLNAIFEKLKNVEDLRIPFDAVQANLNSEEIRFLHSVGMIAESDGEYYLPEIYRFGLGLRLAEGARPKVLSLARRASTFA
jgi:MinD-like ATPase involved in chromosome partitioning or flagellar assembly